MKRNWATFGWPFFVFVSLYAMSANLNDYILTVPPTQSKSEKGSKQTNEAREFITIQSLAFLMNSGGSAIKQQVETHAELTDGVTVGDIAYVRTDTGTQWLPGSLGGTIYSKGFYLWDGSIWTSDRSVIANQFRLNAIELNNMTDLVHTLDVADITGLE